MNIRIRFDGKQAGRKLTGGLIMKKVVITGASSGIGLATAKRMAADGWRVCVTARREQNLLRLVETLPGDGHLTCAGDMTDPFHAERMADVLRDRWETIDAVIHCAGICEYAPAIGSPLAVWRHPFDGMVDGAVHLMRATVPLLNKNGRIVLITSIHGGRVERNLSAYAMAKAALNQYCRALALELSPDGILVNAIAPGFVDTPMSVVDGVNELEGEWFRRNYIEGHHLPLKRAGQPEEIAGVAAFLVGPDATYLTGQVLTVDGGLTITF
jgi:NAD(P)-dependent dehydrogenase (short-subunit alcohol dehydrogenase family)